LNSFTHIADSVMPAARNNFHLQKLNYDTSDIIHLLIKGHKKNLSDTEALAREIKATSIADYTRKLYDLVKRNIAYRLDPEGAQFVKSPAQVWKDKISDCKSYSLFIATTLHNAGIPFRYRFVSFNKSRTPTHVYVIVPRSAGGYITLDAVMPGYNQEKPFTFKKDIDMKGLYYVSGIGEIGGRRAPSPEKRVSLMKSKRTSSSRLRRPIPVRFDLRGRDISTLTSGELDLLIARDRLETSKAIAENMRGIGCFIGEKYQDSIDMIDDALQVIEDHKMGRIGALQMEQEINEIADNAINKKYSLHKSMNGIGSLADRQQIRIAGKAEREKYREQKRETQKISGNQDQLIGWNVSIGKTPKFLKKVAKAVKKGVKAVTKVATAPVRLVAKGALELQLPKAAPMFLYLFINDKSLIEKMPAKARRKRKKAEQLADFIVEGIGMKRDHFMGIVRNGIMKHYGKSPEDVIADQMKGKMSGMGAVQVIAAVVGIVIKLIGAIAKLVKGKKAPKVTADDAPDPSDWTELASTAATSLASSVKKQPENTQQYTDQMTSEITKSETSTAELTEENHFESGGRSIWDTLKF
jgi:hypothetical protein